VADYLKGGNEVHTFPGAGQNSITGVEIISTIKADALIETTPTDLKDGGIATEHIFEAVNRKMEIISANKGPFVLFFEKIFKKAKENQCGLHISAATAAALPTLDVGLTCLAGARVSRIQGILNGTTNYILSQMHIKQTTYYDALKQAQELGIAETDPGYDVEGKDTANKIILISNLVFNKTYGLDDISVQGITKVSFNDIENAKKQGKVIKLIGTAQNKNSRFNLKVAPEILNQGHPLALINGTQKAIIYSTDTMGDITVSGGNSSPVGAAAALLKDLINAFK